MAEERGVLRRIVWRDIFPGLMLFRCFRLSIGLPVLFLATLGALLMPLGPWLARTSMNDESPELVRTELAAAAAAAAAAPEVVLPPARALSTRPEHWLRWSWPPRGLVRAYERLTEPFVRLFDRDLRWLEFVRATFTVLWYLLVWSAVGGAITRIAAVQLGRRERVTLTQAVRYVIPKFGWYFLAPLFPLLGITLGALPLILAGLLMQMNLGVFVAGLLWPLALIFGLVMAVLLAELFFGWPLMWPTISTEESSDAFQAFSNSFSYTFQRPLQYLGYATLAAIIGGIGGMFVEAFARATIQLSYWALSFGLGSNRLERLLDGERDASWFAASGTRLMETGDQLVLLVADAYYFSFFFCAAAAIYLLLRREVDQTGFDEVHLPDDAARYSLPPLRTGPHGVPEVDETAAPLAPPDGPSE